MQGGRHVVGSGLLLRSAAATSTSRCSVPLVHGTLPYLAHPPVAGLLSGISAPGDPPGDAALAAEQRRQSHYAASTSAGSSSSSVYVTWPHRRFSSNANSNIPNTSTVGGGGLERGFASQPAYAYEPEPDPMPVAGVSSVATPAAAPAPYMGAAPTHDLLARAHAAAAALKAKARSRLEESRRDGDYTDGERRLREVIARNKASRKESPRQRLQLRKVEQEQNLAPELPIWERLAHMFTPHVGAAIESSAVLAVYRQEVLHGHDPDAEHKVNASAAFMHVPFLQSGMYAAYQGFGLQSALSRNSLQARLEALQEALHGTSVSRRTAAALEGLRVVMESSRGLEDGGAGAGARGEGKRGGAAPPQELQQSVQPKGTTPPGGDPLAAVAGSGAVKVAEADLAAAAAAAAMEAEWNLAAAEGDEEAYAELEAWEEQQADQAQRARHDQLASATSWSQRAGLSALRPPTPAADRTDVLLMLDHMPGVDVGKVAAAVDELYSGTFSVKRPDAMLPLEPLRPSTDPEESLRQMREVAEVLAQELGATQFVSLVRQAPWVLLLDPHTQGRPQLGCLHLIDMGRRERAKLVRAFPRLLTINADAHLLPLFAYLQGLGLSNRQIAHFVRKEPRVLRPSSLPSLQAMAAFWLGKGMAKSDLAGMVEAFPEAYRCNLATWQMKYDWLAEHVGFTVQDAARMPWFVERSINSFGPRIALALSRGAKFVRPSESRDPSERNNGAGPSHPPNHSQASLAGLPGARDHPFEFEPNGGTGGKDLVLTAFLRATERVACKRLGLTLEEYEAFKPIWEQRHLPAWLKRREAGIERYRRLTGTRKHPPPAAAAAVFAADGALAAGGRAGEVSGRQGQQQEQQQQQDLWQPLTWRQDGPAVQHPQQQTTAQQQQQQLQMGVRAAGAAAAPAGVTLEEGCDEVFWWDKQAQAQGQRQQVVGVPFPAGVSEVNDDDVWEQQAAYLREQARLEAAQDFCDGWQDFAVAEGEWEDLEFAVEEQGRV